MGVYHPHINTLQENIMIKALIIIAGVFAMAMYIGASIGGIATSTIGRLLIGG